MKKLHELKFRYTFKRKEDGHIWQMIVPFGVLEQQDRGQILEMLNNELWEFIARDQFIWAQDSAGVDLYEHDIVYGEMGRHFKGIGAYNGIAEIILNPFPSMAGFNVRNPHINIFSGKCTKLGDRYSTPTLLQEILAPRL